MLVTIKAQLWPIRNAAALSAHSDLDEYKQTNMFSFFHGWISGDSHYARTVNYSGSRIPPPKKNLNKKCETNERRARMHLNLLIIIITIRIIGR